MLMNNANANGSIDVDNFQRAMLIYRNAIDPDTKASPAMIVFGRQIRDPIPVVMGRYCPHPTWSETLDHREKALAKRHSREREKWEQHTKTLPALRVGDRVYVQNQVGNHPRRWERTGTVVEVRQFHQYVIKVDGSGRLTLRNRQYLRKFIPFKKDPCDSLIESLPPALKADIPEVSQPNPIISPPLTESLNQVPEEETEEPPTTQEEETPSNNDNQRETPPQDTHKPSKLARALSRLQPHNQPGAAEGLPPTGRLRSRRE